MNAAHIRELAEAGHSRQTLQEAEQALLEGRILAIDVPGETAGDKLTTVLAARWMLEHEEETGNARTEALRNYMAMVRRSITLPGLE